MNENSIESLARRLLSKIEYEEILRISNSKNGIFHEMVQFDKKLGGAGIHNINDGDLGRYHIEDRDVYRPFQYIRSYFQMDSSSVAWVTREIVHMCGLHLESLIKKLSLLSRLPLGNALTQSAIRRHFDNQTYQDLKAIVGPYNEAKHNVSQEMDTHLFDLKSALLCYASTRKLSILISPKVKLYTPEQTWV